MARRPGRWLRRVRADGGVAVPGRPGRRACDLVLGPDRVTIRADDEIAHLEWGHFEVPARHREADRWSIAEWSRSGRAGPIGIGLDVAGACVDATAGVRARRRGPANRLNRVHMNGQTVPLYALGRVGGGA